MHRYEHPLAYFTDCLMATADSLTMLSKPPKREVDRHLLIIQRCINTMQAENIPIETGRQAKVVKEFGGDVAAWARRYYAGASQLPEVSPARSATEMLSEVATFIDETLSAPSARLAGPGEMSRHRSIREKLSEHLAAPDDGMSI